MQKQMKHRRRRKLHFLSSSCFGAGRHGHNKLAVACSVPSLASATFWPLFPLSVFHQSEQLSVRVWWNRDTTESSQVCPTFFGFREGAFQYSLALETVCLSGNRETSCTDNFSMRFWWTISSATTIVIFSIDEFSFYLSGWMNLRYCFDFLDYHNANGTDPHSIPKPKPTKRLVSFGRVNVWKAVL